jgi:predicted Zn finger-like uncharacterized protein
VLPRVVVMPDYHALDTRGATGVAMMLIVLDCPGCSKRYEIDASLAGKKSRCKQCGEVFKIPVPTAVVGQSAPAAKSPVAAPTGSRAAERSFSGSPAKAPNATHAGAPDQPALVAPAIVINCPRCRSRYELDVALAGKKSRCKNCGEIFTIPVPHGLMAESTSSRGPAAAAAREPAPASSQWQALLEDEPRAIKASRGPAVADLDDVDLPPPPRAAYLVKRRRSRGSDDTGQIDVAVTISGWYFLIGLILCVGFFIFTHVANPSPAQTSLVGGIILLLLVLVGIGLSLWGSFWLLLIAFEESTLQGVLCLLAPLYAFGYIIGRFEKTRGVAALIFSSLVIIVLFGVAGAIDSAVRFSDGARVPRASADDGGAPGGDSSGDWQPGSSAQKRTANRRAVEAAEKAAREYITALDAATSQLAAVGREGAAPGQRSSAVRNFAVARTAGSRIYQMKLGVDEMTALKYRIGEKVRSSLLAAKAEMTRIESISGQPGVFRSSLERIDKELELWAIQPHDDVIPALVDGPSIPLGNIPDRGPGPRPGIPDRGDLRGNQPGRRAGADRELNYQRFLAEHGDTAVTIFFFGLPANSDASRGVTAREVSEAVSKRLRELAPSATNSLRQRHNNRTLLVLAPVDDIEALARSIDFGKATVKGRVIDLEISPDFVANVPRLPAESPSPKGAAETPSRRNATP